MEILATFNDEHITDEDLKNFQHRRAVRGVVFDVEKNIALLHVPIRGYYGLPGGGVDAEESLEQAIEREMKEEIGCAVQRSASLGRILEYRKNDSLVNESECYICDVVGEKGSPILMGDENEEEKASVVVWVPLEKAIDLMKAIPLQANLYSQYCINRDLVFLEKTSEILDAQKDLL